MKTLHHTNQGKTSRHKKKHSFSVETPKHRGEMPPPGFAHRPKSSYNRRDFKNNLNWED